MLSSEKRINSKIKKSDDIIVVAKTPIEEIIKQTTAAKEVKQAIKKIVKKETLDVKIKKIKAKISEKAHQLYAQARRLISNNYSNIYSDEKIDYSKLFNYLGKSKILTSEYEEAAAKTEKFQRDELGEKEIVQEQDLMSYLGRFMLNQFTGQAMNDISIEEKEKMNYYLMFNKTWVMMKINLLGFGEKTYHSPRDE